MGNKCEQKIHWKGNPQDPVESESLIEWLVVRKLISKWPDVALMHIPQIHP